MNTMDIDGIKTKVLITALPKAGWAKGTPPPAPHPPNMKGPQTSLPSLPPSFLAESQRTGIFENNFGKY